VPHEYDRSNGRAPEITLRPIDIDDWAAVHEWASTIEACRYHRTDKSGSRSNTQSPSG
jgi:hypothetical protein